MDFLNPVALLVAAISALIIGSIWYNPKVFGRIWMQEAHITKASLKPASVIKILLLAFVFAFLLAMTMMQLSIHQTGALSLVGGDANKALPSYTAFMLDYGTHFRTFKHGALHGIFAGIFIALPIVGTNAILERKSAKYIFINAGYWIVTLGTMGAIICGWQ